ncbi:MAG: hypothetical protein WD534_08560 [Phycisphaeraceae bacterium]
MAEASHGRVACPNCGKAYRWKPDLAGRKVACKCGQKMRLPASATGEVEAIGPPPNPNEASTYDLEFNDESHAGTAAVAGAAAAHAVDADAPSASAAPGKCPACNQALKPGAVLCIKCGYNLQTGSQLQTAVVETPEPDASDDTPADAPAVSAAPADGPAATLKSAARTAGFDPDRTKIAMSDDSQFVDLYLPLTFFAAGLVGIFVLSFWLSETLLGGLIDGGIILAVQLLITTPLLLLAVCLTAFAVGINFGYLGRAIFKLSAICVGPGVLGDIVAILVLPFFHGIIAFVFIGCIIYLLFLGIPLSLMFKLDFHETAITVAVAIFVRIFTLLLLLATLFAMLL